MLAVGPSELTKNLLPELAKDTAMRWDMVTDKPQEFFGLSLCRTPQGYTFGVSCDYVTKLCKDFGFGELKGSNTLSFEKLDWWSLRGNRNARPMGAKCAIAHLLCTDSSAALGFVKRKGGSRPTRHVGTKVYFMQAWAMEPGLRILKVHGDSRQVADCLTKIVTPQVAHRRALGF